MSAIQFYFGFLEFLLTLQDLVGGSLSSFAWNTQNASGNFSKLCLDKNCSVLVVDI